MLSTRVIDPDVHPSVTLWFETLSTGDTARLCIRSTELSEVDVAFYWNNELHSHRRFGTKEEAEAWGIKFRDVLRQDTIAGVLLGYDRDVLERLQENCSAAS